jgi:antitoxin component of MazEF toxin-antitoxin module
MIQTKQIKKWGDSLIITISPEDARIMKLKEGDVVQVEMLKEIRPELDTEYNNYVKGEQNDKSN